MATPSPLDRIDPEIRAGLDAMLAITGAGGFRNYTLAERRAIYEANNAAALAATPDDPTVAHSDHQIPGYLGDPIVVRVYRPASTPSSAVPGILYIHGGGLNHGSILTDERQAKPLVHAVDGDAVVVSVEYRLAPEHPQPIPVEDCYAALLWMHDHTTELGIDPTRIALYGGSAGGGLAAGVALLARDRRGPAIAFQMLLYPMLEDRCDTPSSYEITDIGIWDRDLNLEAWTFLRGEGEAELDQYSAPARATELRGLPRTYLDVGELDGFRDEGIAYASRLMAAGVPVELHVYPGGIHASELLAPDAALSRRIAGYRAEALRRALD